MNNAEALRKLREAAHFGENFRASRALSDLSHSLEPAPEDEPPMTFQELSHALGLDWNDEKGIRPTTPQFLNACISAQSNERVQKLPDVERIRILRNVGNAIDFIMDQRP